MTTLTQTENTILNALAEEYPLGDVRTRDINAMCDRFGAHPTVGKSLQNKMQKIHKGFYNFNALIVPIERKVQSEDDGVADVFQTTPQVREEIFVPEKNDLYVKWGHAKDVEKIIKSGMFYPIWIAGLSGNGKTFMVEQACARLGREMLRVQISEDTDEDSLIGGFRLENGATVFSEGPVVRAMKRGAVLLIDEMDRPERPLMCLQGVLEGKPILIKKTGELVHPAPGFTVIATGNTLGRGSDDGKFISARILDEALMERFILTFCQPYPTPAVEKRIIMKHMDHVGKIDEEFADKLVLWADAIRKTYEDDGVEDVITTRRLCHIVQTYAIFEDRMKAIELCVSRFEADSKTAFKDLYAKIDVNASNETPTPTSNDDDEIPF